MTTHTAHRPAPPLHAGRALVLFLLAGAGLAIVAALTTLPVAGAWYTRTGHPAVSIPLVVVAAVWAVLDLLDGLAGWLLWCRLTGSPRTRGSMGLYWVQLVLQAALLIAFAAQALVAGAALWSVFAIILVLDLVTAAAVWASWAVSRSASVLLALVLVWCLIGTLQSWNEVTIRTLSGG